MRAITVNEYGAAPALTEMPDPQPGPGQLLIRTEAAGMNPMDRTIANGGWKEAMSASFPLIIGADLAGVIEAGEYTFRTSTQIETAAPQLDWLNKGVFIRVAARQPAGAIYETYVVE